MTRTIPLRDRYGAIRAEVLVDDEDYDWITAGKAWCLHVSGYAIRDHGKELMHRLILGLESGEKRQIDHINFDKLDNRRSNLRVTDALTNNRRKPAHANGTSKHRNVSWCKRRHRWRVQVRPFGGGRSFDRYFVSEAEAVEVAARARLNLRGSVHA